MAPEVKPAKNSKLPKLPENYFEPVEKGGWPPISTWIIKSSRQSTKGASIHCVNKGVEVEHNGTLFDYRSLMYTINKRETTYQ